MPTQIPSWAIWVPLIGAISGSVVTGLIALWMNRQNRKSEERKHLKELAFKTAVDNWKTRIDIAQKIDVKIRIQPLDSFIIHMMKLSELLVDQDITKESVGGKIKEIREITNAMEETYKEINE